jgi:hypothetical protein
MSLIGWVTYEPARNRTAALHADGSWTFAPPLAGGEDDAATAYVLATISGRYAGPSSGPFGPAQLAEAAEFLGGVCRLAPTVDDPPGLRY